MWKYTKGDERDFGGDKYPFATHMLRPIYGFGIKPFPAALNVGQDVDSKLFEVVARRERIASWGGNGLPPVGTEVECRCDEGDIKCVVLGYDFNNAAVVLRDIERKTYFAAQTTMVRPLRTERNKAIDQMNRAVNDADSWRFSDIEAIYDAIVAGKIDGLGKVG